MTVTEILSQEKQQLLFRVSTINRALALIEDSNNNIHWTQRAFDCIKLHNKIMVSPDILIYMFKNELDVLDNIKLRHQYMTNLSCCLGRLVNKGKLIKYKRNTSKGYWYALPEWFDDKGKLKKEYDVKFIKD